MSANPLNINPNFSRKSGLYRYSFNGQEKEVDITGTNTHTSAEFWMYDTRLGRRWEVDPKPVPSVSQYACVLNSPILLNDILGDTARFNYSYNDENGNLASKEIFRFDDPSTNINFTLSENLLPENFRGTIATAVGNLQSPLAVSSSSIKENDDADAIMASVGMGLGFVAGGGISFDIVKPNQGPDANTWLFYFSYQVGFTSGGGLSAVMGEVDVRDDLESTMDRTMFEGASNVWSAGIFGVYQNVKSYGYETTPECSAFGINCPDDSEILYEADLWGCGGEIAAMKGGSYSFFFGSLKPLQK